MNTSKLELKANLLVEGIRFDPGALEGVGSAYKEQNHGLFGWDFVDHPDTVLPDDIVLSDGTVTQFRYCPTSPYVMARRNDAPAIVRDGEVLDRARFIPRPRYYDATTRGGTVMRRIAQIGGVDCFFVCYQNYCSHFATGQECAFCNLVATKKTYDSVLTRKDVAEIGEVAAAAFSEGTCKHILLTGGCFSHQKEVALVCSIVESTRDALGVDGVPGTILPSPTIQEDDLKRYHDTGIGAIGFSMEIWDPALYRAICPGKASSTSHEAFLAGIRAAVRVFGAGNVYGVFVMGLEPRVSFLEGIRTLSDIGANVVPFVWSPNPGSKLQGHRAPTARWYVDTILEAASIVRKSGVPVGTRNHCYQCDGNSLLYDALRALE